MAITIKWNILPGMEGLADNYVFTVRKGDFEMYIGSTGNCGIPIISSVSAGYRISGYGRLPRPHTDDFGTTSSAAAKLAADYVAKQYAAPSKADLDDYFKKFLDKTRANGANCFILTDSVNRHSEHRNGHSSSFISTGVFAELLYENKVGYTVRSPVAVNKVHQAPGDFSLVRAYVWFPPWAIAFKEDKYLGRGTIEKTADAAYDKFVKNQMPPSWANKLDELKQAFHSWRK